MKEHLTQDEEKFKKYRYSLSDYTATTEFDVSNESVELIAKYCQKASIVNPEAVVAIVANQDLIYGLARMWEMLSYKTEWEKMVLRNREDAEAWIKERVKGKYGIGDLSLAEAGLQFRCGPLQPLKPLVSHMIRTRFKK